MSPTKRFPFQVFPKSVTRTIHTVNSKGYQSNQDFPFEDFPKSVAENNTLFSLIFLFPVWIGVSKFMNNPFRSSSSPMSHRFNPKPLSHSILLTNGIPERKAHVVTVVLLLPRHYRLRWRGLHRGAVKRLLAIGAPQRTILVTPLVFVEIPAVGTHCPKRRSLLLNLSVKTCLECGVRENTPGFADTHEGLVRKGKLVLIRIQETH